jgi:hypothetical protein
MGTIRKQLASERGLQESQQTERFGRAFIETHIVGWNRKFCVVPSHFAMADSVFFLQLCGGWYFDSVTFPKLRFRMNS